MNRKLTTSYHHSKDELEERVIELHKQSPFYHVIDLGQGVVTPGHYGHYLGKVSKLLDYLQLDGRKCLDIGCMDGKMSFEMEKRGGKVIAIDQYDRPNMRFCVDTLESQVQYMPGVKLDSMFDALVSSSLAPFDFILNSGVLYHAISPLQVLIDCRRMLKNGGFMILETGFVDRDDNAMYFQCDEGGYSPGTFFFLSRGVLLHMLLFVCFVPLVMISEKDRIAILCQAVKPSEMPRINPYHDQHHFNWNGLQPGAADALEPLSIPELENLPKTMTHPVVPGSIEIPPAIDIILPGSSPQISKEPYVRQLPQKSTNFVKKVFSYIIRQLKH